MNHLDPVLADPIGLQHPGDLPRTDDETIDRPSVLEVGETGETAAMDGKTHSSLDDGFRTGAQPDARQQATRMSMGGVILDDLRIQFTNQMSKFHQIPCPAHRQRMYRYPLGGGSSPERSVWRADQCRLVSPSE